MDEIKFKIRCSQIGNIMTSPRSKAAKERGELSETSKSYCKLWLLEQKFNRRKEISSKYFDKGNECEQPALDFLIENKVVNFLATKNEKFFGDNDFMHGTPDVILPDEIIDLKNSWNLFSFPFFDTECKNKLYYWQLQGYMELTGIDHARLIYVLSNTPEHLIENEIHYKTKDFEYLEKSDFEKIEKEIRKNHIFDDILAKDRVRIFEFQKDESSIEQIEQKVYECQHYIDELLE